MARKPFAVRIFLADGTVDGVKIIAKSKWPGRAIFIPRAQLPQELERPELDAPGAYILIGPSAKAEVTDRPALFIGWADPISDRLGQHQAATDFWSAAIVFSAKKEPLPLTHCAYLAARLLQRAAAVQQSHLVDPQPPSLPELTADEQIEVELFLDHMLSICPLLGLNAFEPVKKMA